MGIIPWHVVLRGALQLLPPKLKVVLYERAAKASAWFGCEPYVNIFRLPFGLILKVVSRPYNNEGRALELVQSIRGVNTPRLVD